MAVKDAEADSPFVNDFHSADEEQDAAIRKELWEIVDTLYGARLPAARRYLRELMAFEDKMEAEIASNSTKLKQAVKDAQDDRASGRTTRLEDARHDV